MAGNAGLMNAHRGDKIVDRLFPPPQRIEHAATGWISQSLKGIYMHICAYILTCI